MKSVYIQGILIPSTQSSFEDINGSLTHDDTQYMLPNWNFSLAEIFSRLFMHIHWIQMHYGINAMGEETCANLAPNVLQCCSVAVVSVLSKPKEESVN